MSDETSASLSIDIAVECVVKGNNCCIERTLKYGQDVNPDQHIPCHIRLGSLPGIKQSLGSFTSVMQDFFSII